MKKKNPGKNQNQIGARDNESGSKTKNKQKILGKKNYSGYLQGKRMVRTIKRVSLVLRCH